MIIFFTREFSFCFFKAKYIGLKLFFKGNADISHKSLKENSLEQTLHKVTSLLNSTIIVTSLQNQAIIKGIAVQKQMIHQMDNQKNNQILDRETLLK